MLLVIDCWNMLGSERSIGFAVGPIPYRAVLEWCDRRPFLDAEMTEMITKAINHMDAERMKAETAKAAADKRAGETGRKR